MVTKKTVGKNNQPKGIEAWLVHHDKFISLLPKVAGENIQEIINRLKETKLDCSNSAQVLTQLNDLRFEKPYNTKWPDWTKKISNSTAGSLTKVECSQYNVRLIDKIRENGRLGSRRASLDFIIETFRPIIESAIDSRDLEELPERIRTSIDIDEIRDERIAELMAEVSQLTKEVDNLQEEIQDCPDPIHGLDLEE